MGLAGFSMVGVARIELATPAMSTQCEHHDAAKKFPENRCLTLSYNAGSSVIRPFASGHCVTVVSAKTPHR
jgi:hypothetical protein